MLKGKKIIVAVTGSIAAYKAAMLVRLLVKKGAEVKVLMTPLAKEFITPLTMATLSKNPILVEFFNPENGEWNSHVGLGEWADAMLIAPATANTIAKMATGVADNLVMTTYLSARCPVFVAPAMDLDMYKHPTTRYNIDTLQGYGNHIIEPAEGELASGLSGKGRMEEPEKIVEHVCDFFEKKKSLDGLTFMVTAGPTIEPIDPVRYLTNHSSGKMGYAIASELRSRGAKVLLISGKTSLMPPYGVETIEVTTAQEMYDISIKAFKECDGAVMCAAVADYTPVSVSQAKIKKNISLEGLGDGADGVQEVACQEVATASQQAATAEESIAWQQAATAAIASQEAVTTVVSQEDSAAAVASQQTATTKGATAQNAATASVASQQTAAQEVAAAATEVATATTASQQTATAEKATPQSAASHNNISLSLTATPDIAAALGRIKGNKLLVGFALETENEQDSAKSKLRSKNLDFIVLNSLADQGAGFGGDTNVITIFDSKGESKSFGLKSKKDVAADIVNEMERYFSK